MEWMKWNVIMKLYLKKQGPVDKAKLNNVNQKQCIKRGEWFLTEKNPCKPNPCKNGGSCSTNGGQSFECHCKSQYEGRYCETGMIYLYAWMSHIKIVNRWNGWNEME